MKTILISVNRTFDVKELKAEWLKKSPKGQFGKTDLSFEVASDLDEAVKTEGGKQNVYDSWLKQKRLDIQNDVANKIAAVVLDPEKTKKRSTTSVEVDLPDFK